MFLRDCGVSSDCADVVLRTPYNKMATSRTCCTTDLCTPTMPKAIPDGSQNRLTCPGCLSLKSNVCVANKTVYCRNNENRCFSYASQPDKNNVFVSLSGCATQTGCNLELTSDTKVVCTAESDTGDTSGSSCFSLSVLTMTFTLLVTLMN